MSTPSTFSQIQRFLAIAFASAALVSLGAQAWSLGSVCAVAAAILFALSKEWDGKGSESNNNPKIPKVPDLDMASPSIAHATACATGPINSSQISEKEDEAEEEMTPLQKLHKLLEALPSDYDERMEELLHQISDINEICDFSGEDRTAIELAAASLAPVGVLSRLVSAGGTLSTDVATDEGWLSNYIEEDADIETILFLLNAGVSANDPSEYSESLTAQAISGHRPDIVKALLDHGATPTDDEDDWLELALNEEQYEVVPLLLSSSTAASLDLQSAMFIALDNSSLAPLAYLLAMGSDPMLPDEDDETPVKYAIENSNDETILLMAMPLSGNDRWRLLGHCQAVSEDRELATTLEGWMTQLSALERAWMSGYGSPEHDSSLPTVDPTLSGPLSNIDNVSQAQAIVLAGVPVFSDPGQPSPYNTAVKKQDALILSTYLEALSDHNASQCFDALTSSPWVNDARTLLAMRRALRDRFLSTQVPSQG